MVPAARPQLVLAELIPKQFGNPVFDWIGHHFVCNVSFVPKGWDAADCATFILFHVTLLYFQMKLIFNFLKALKYTGFRGNAKFLHLIMKVSLATQFITTAIKTSITFCGFGQRVYVLVNVVSQFRSRDDRLSATN